MIEDAEMRGSPSPWYRQFWPWFLIAVPAAAVVMGITTILLALHEPDGLVSDDYYREGLAVNRDLERDREAAQRGLRARVHLDSDAGTVRVDLSGELPARPQVLELFLHHPTRARKDLATKLYRDALGSYIGVVNLSRPAYWYLSLEPQDRSWWLRGRIRLPGSGEVMLAPPS